MILIHLCLLTIHDIDSHLLARRAPVHGSVTFFYYEKYLNYFYTYHKCALLWVDPFVSKSIADAMALPFIYILYLLAA